MMIAASRIVNGKRLNAARVKKKILQQNDFLL
jgi:hypothetical protein